LLFPVFEKSLGAIECELAEVVEVVGGRVGTGANGGGFWEEKSLKE